MPFLATTRPATVPATVTMPATVPMPRRPAVRPFTTTTQPSATTLGDAPVQRRHGAPRDLSGVSTGNPFARYSALGGPCDATPAGYTDLRRNLPPAHEMKIPHRVSVWPDGTPSASALAACHGR